MDADAGGRGGGFLQVQDAYGWLPAEIGAGGEGAFERNRQVRTTLIDCARNRCLVKSVQSVQTTPLILGPSTLDEIRPRG